MALERVMPETELNESELADFWEAIVPPPEYVFAFFPLTGSVMERALVRLVVKAKPKPNTTVWKVAFDEIVWKATNFNAEHESSIREVCEVEESEVIVHRDDALGRLEKMRQEFLAETAKQRTALNEEIRIKQNALNEVGHQEGAVNRLTLPATLPIPHRQFAGIERL